MKAFFIVPQITHYRLTFYEKLIRSNPSINWLIVDGEKKVSDGRPTLYQTFTFPAKRFEESVMYLGPYTLRDYKGLFPFVQAEKPDLVIMPTIVGTKAYRQIAGWCRKNHKRLILWSCLWEHENASRSILKGLKQIALERFLHLATDHIVYSTYAKRILMNYGVKEDLIHIAYNGLDIEDMHRHALDEVSVLSEKARLEILKSKTLLYVGGLGPDKKVDILLRAFSSFNARERINNLKLLIIGEGPERAFLERLASELNLNDKVSFLGRIVKDADKYFQITDGYVLPGAGGLGLNQAMYWSKPCIVSHADGTDEDLVFDGVTGFRFERSSVVGLENAIRAFYYTSADQLLQMGAKAKEIILHRSNVNQMVKVFTETINHEHSHDIEIQKTSDLLT